MANENQECAVYFLVEPHHFKIGISISISDRARKVTPHLIQDKSWAIYYKSIRAAQNCEHVLHRIFRSYRVPSLSRDGGTEFFDLSCLEKAYSFVHQNKAALEYIDIKYGRELFPPFLDSLPDPIKEERRRKRIEKENLEKQRIILTNQQGRKNFIETFEILHKKKCFIGIHTQENSGPDTPLQIYAVSFSADDDQLIHSLTSSYYHSKTCSGKLLSDIFSCAPPEKISMALITDGTPTYRVYRISTAIRPSSEFNCYELSDFYNAKDNILSLPYIEQQEHMLLISEISIKERDFFGQLALMRYLSRSFL